MGEQQAEPVTSLSAWRRIKMFTGLVEEIGAVTGIKPSYDGLQISISAPLIAKSLPIGASVAVDGVCQTVTETGKERFTIQAVGETLLKTTFRCFSPGRKVNLERAMPANGRFDGHVVQGHINGIGRITRWIERGNHFFLEIDVPVELCRYIVEEGSISIDGVSLTVAGIKVPRVGISIIPHTIRNCTLSCRKVGDPVNIETDLFSRYVERQLEIPKKVLNESTLEKWGY
jgi:riboflavin synthase